MLLKRYIILEDRCTSCQHCIAACPVGAITLSAQGNPEIQIAKCRRCGACKKACQHRAVTTRVKLRF